ENCSWRTHLLRPARRRRAMRLRNILSACWMGACLLSASVLADGTDEPTANGNEAVVVDPTAVIDQFAAFAGSRQNAEALVEGLRAGTEVALQEREGTTVRFTSPAGPMGYGNVSVALSLAQTELAIQGIAEPSARDIVSALVGGESQVGGKTVPLRGVLVLRAEGLPWSYVADELGFTLGDAASVSSTADPELRAERAARSQRKEVEIIDRSIQSGRAGKAPRAVEFPAK